MRFYDIFNGDADGLCALQQLRLAEPRDATLVTGVKRDIALLARVVAQPADALTVLDISLDTNRDGLTRALQAGARVQYFDHHYAGEIPRHAQLEAHIDTSPALCTSLIVDRHLEGRFRGWAIAAAFGDNLHAEANAAAAGMGLTAVETSILRTLGESLNYNAYGRDLADLHFHPAELYARLRPFADPVEYCRQAEEIEVLRQTSADELRRALALRVEHVGKGAVLVTLPDEAWARRVAGIFANALARQYGERIVALLLRAGNGYQVSLRAPADGDIQVHLLARQFESGSGRARAAGIQFLSEDSVPKLLALLAADEAKS